MNLTPHEEKILELIKKHPEVVSDPEIRRQVAKKNSLSEKTLRNRIADFKKYGLLGSDKRIISVQKTQQIINESDEIDLLVVWNILLQKKWSIFKITGFFTTIGIIYSLLATPYFQSTISLYPAG